MGAAACETEARTCETKETWIKGRVLHPPWLGEKERQCGSELREAAEQEERDEVWKLHLSIKHPKMTWGKTEASSWATTANASRWNAAGRSACCFHPGRRAVRTEAAALETLLPQPTESPALETRGACGRFPHCCVWRQSYVACNKGNFVCAVFRSLFCLLDSGIKILLSNFVLTWVAKIDLTLAEMYINVLPRLYMSLNERIINRRIRGSLGV